MESVAEPVDTTNFADSALIRYTDEGTVMSVASFVFRAEKKSLKVGLGCVTNVFGNEDVIMCAL